MYLSGVTRNEWTSSILLFEFSGNQIEFSLWSVYGRKKSKALLPIISLVLVRSYLQTPRCPAGLVSTTAVFFPRAFVLNCTCAIGLNTKSVNRVHWNVKCEKRMTVMPVISLDHWRTNVKGHYDISIESSTQPTFFPGRLQSDLSQCSIYTYAHAYMPFSITSSCGGLACHPCAML